MTELAGRSGQGARGESRVLEFTSAGSMYGNWLRLPPWLRTIRSADASDHGDDERPIWPVPLDRVEQARFRSIEMGALGIAHLHAGRSGKYSRQRRVTVAAMSSRQLTSSGYHGFLRASMTTGEEYAR